MVRWNQSLTITVIVSLFCIWDLTCGEKLYVYIYTYIHMCRWQSVVKALFPAHTYTHTHPHAYTDTAQTQTHRNTLCCFSGDTKWKASWYRALLWNHLLLWGAFTYEIWLVVRFSLQALQALQHNATYTTAHTATHYSTLQHTVTHCNKMQHTAQQTATNCNIALESHLANTATLMQHTATHCNTLQHTATHCNTLQLTATHCNTIFESHRANTLMLLKF